jgi:hypothetical protein
MINIFGKNHMRKWPSKIHSDARRRRRRGEGVGRRRGRRRHALLCKM